VKKKDRKKSYQIFQNHHITYKPEYTVRITRTEHFFCGRMQRYWEARGITKGMREWLRHCAKTSTYKLNKEKKI
jgi:hypothetical protein